MSKKRRKKSKTRNVLRRTSSRVRFAKPLAEALEERRLLAADIQNVGSFTRENAQSLEIEIGGTTPGAGGYDQINVADAATLDGGLAVSLIDVFEPSVGDTFDFMTFDSITGQFASAAGLYGFGDGSMYFDIVEQPDRLQLVVKESFGAQSLISQTGPLQDVLGKFYSDYFPALDSLSFPAEIQIGDNA